MTIGPRRHPHAKSQRPCGLPFTAGRASAAVSPIPTSTAWARPCPRPQATGNLSLRPHSIAAELTYDAKRGRIHGVRVIDARTRRDTEYKARVVFLCASAIESVRLLLNSKSAHFPDGLANSSGTLGRYVMDHHLRLGRLGHHERLRGSHHVRPASERHLHRALS